ncbi:MAG: hypothetical protein PHH40_04175 [Candidatus Moranbacteria bacterium]|nr:hypothetical protein [Candidatus Moranbacteria bacterium]MDD3964566.1 hypothetical protein [Candidatus Moranbacteria bacterium]
MKNIFHIGARVIFSLILVMPIFGVLGIFPDPTRDLYNTDEAFAFIQVLSDSGFIMWMMAVVHVIALYALWTRREAVAALLVLPITLNVVGFHLVLDGGLFTAGAVMADVMLALNLYLLWKHQNVLTTLWHQED